MFEKYSADNYLNQNLQEGKACMTCEISHNTLPECNTKKDFQVPPSTHPVMIHNLYKLKITYKQKDTISFFCLGVKTFQSQSLMGQSCIRANAKS